MLECPSHALGIPCQIQRERQLRVKIVAVFKITPEWRGKPRGEGAWNQERFAEGAGIGGGTGDELDEGGVVGGVFVEVVGVLVEGAGAGGVPDEKTCCGGGHASDKPDELFHTRFPSRLHYEADRGIEVGE